MIQPRRFRSNRGVETILLADAHYEIRKKADPLLTPKDYYIYGRSVNNQRIKV
jgi:hypothetical protein